MLKKTMPYWFLDFLNFLLTTFVYNYDGHYKQSGAVLGESVILEVVMMIICVLK
jgi:hypothetical protein